MYGLYKHVYHSDVGAQFNNSTKTKFQAYVFWKYLSNQDTDSHDIGFSLHGHFLLSHICILLVPGRYTYIYAYIMLSKLILKAANIKMNVILKGNKNEIIEGKTIHKNNMTCSSIF